MTLNVPQALASHVIAGKEGLAVASAVVPSLAGHSVTSYAQSFMIAGIIISVIGVATAIFTTSILVGVGFGLAGIVSIVGVFVAQSAFEGEQLQNSIAQLSRQNVFLEDQRIRLDSACRLLQGENDRLKEAQGSLDIKHKELERENIRIGQISSDLRASLEGLAGANALLSESRSVVVSQVVRLQGYVTEAKTTLQTFLETHREFSTTVSSFTGAIANLDKTEDLILRAITDLENEVVAAIPTLKSHVALATEISGYIGSRIETQRQQQSLAIDAYRNQITALTTHIESLERYVRDLERINAGFASQIQGSEVIESLQGEYRNAIAPLIRTLEDSSSRFETERGLLRAEAETLQTTFTTLVAEKDALLAALGPSLMAIAESARANFQAPSA